MNKEDDSPVAPLPKQAPPAAPAKIDWEVNNISALKEKILGLTEKEKRLFAKSMGINYENHPQFRTAAIENFLS